MLELRLMLLRFHQLRRRPQFLLRTQLRYRLRRLRLPQNHVANELSRMPRCHLKPPADSQLPNLQDPHRPELPFRTKVAIKTDPIEEIVRSSIKVSGPADSAAAVTVVDVTTMAAVKSARCRVTVITVVTATIEEIATTVAIVTIAVTAIITPAMAEDSRAATINKIKIISKAAVRVIAAATKTNKRCIKVARAATTASADNKRFVVAKE